MRYLQSQNCQGAHFWALFVCDSYRDVSLQFLDNQADMTDIKTTLLSLMIGATISLLDKLEQAI